MTVVIVMTAVIVGIAMIEVDDVLTARTLSTMLAKGFTDKAIKKRATDDAGVVVVSKPSVVVNVVKDVVSVSVSQESR
jgi:hypothetical protein